MAIYSNETDGNLTKEIEIIVTRNYYKSGIIKVIVPIDLDENNLNIVQFLEDEGLAEELEDNLQDDSFNSNDNSDEYKIN